MLSISQPIYEISNSLRDENSHLQRYEGAHIKSVMTLSERLKTAREYAGLTQKELADRVGINQAVISNIERGTAGSSKKLPAIARACGVRSDWLTLEAGPMLDEPNVHLIRDESGGDYAIGNVKPAYEPPTTRKAPVISHVQAGGWSEAIDIFAPGYAERWEPVPETACPNAFWLEVRGDSMTAPAGLSIPEGYLVLVEPGVQEENGSLVVAKLDDENEATFKKLVIDGPNKYLKPLNPDYRTITINGNCRIVGTVTEVKMKLR